MKYSVNLTYPVQYDAEIECNENEIQSKISDLFGILKSQIRFDIVDGFLHIKDMYGGYTRIGSYTKLVDTTYTIIFTRDMSLDADFVVDLDTGRILKSIDNKFYGYYVNIPSTSVLYFKYKCKFIDDLRDVEFYRDGVDFYFYNDVLIESHGKTFEIYRPINTICFVDEKAPVTLIHTASMIITNKGYLVKNRFGEDNQYIEVDFTKIKFNKLYSMSAIDLETLESDCEQATFTMNKFNTGFYNKDVFKSTFKRKIPIEGVKFIINGYPFIVMPDKTITSNSFERLSLETMKEVMVEFEKILTQYHFS